LFFFFKWIFVYISLKIVFPLPSLFATNELSKKWCKRRIEEAPYHKTVTANSCDCHTIQAHNCSAFLWDICCSLLATSFMRNTNIYSLIWFHDTSHIGLEANHLRIWSSISYVKKTTNKTTLYITQSHNIFALFFQQIKSL